jgi:hypothetical protein
MSHTIANRTYGFERPLTGATIAQALERVTAALNRKASAS